MIDRKALREQLFGLVNQTLLDGVQMAMRNFSFSAGPHYDPERWQVVSDAVDQINTAFEQVENPNIPLASALRNLATRSVEFRHIASALDPERSRQAAVIDRLCCAATTLKEVAAIQRNEVLATDGPSR